MREIKFRAWCEGNHDNMTFTKPFMDYNVTIVDGKYASVEGGWDIHGTYSSIPLMQYTGLKDKSGVEIYEGDIIKQGGWICVCIYTSGRFMLKVINHKKGVRYHNFFNSMEWHGNQDKGIKVIGNIHENPEP